MLCPPPLAPGDRIRIVAASSGFDEALIDRGIRRLSQRYRVEFEAGMYQKLGFLAGPDERRVAELNRALSDPDLRAIVAARGGYGATRIVHRADFRALSDCPKWLVGFSDTTALLAEALRFGVASLHAANLGGVAELDEPAFQRWINALERPLETRCLTGLECWRPGVACGALAGGNLSVLYALSAAHRLQLPSGAILLLEDVTESAYRVDRMLTALLSSGTLDGISAILIGDFTDCSAGKHGVPVDAVLRERLSQLRVPILAGVPVGHGHRNEPVPLGLIARVDAVAGTVLFNPDV